MKTLVRLLLLAFGVVTAAPAISPNQLDTFSSGLLESWNGAAPDIADPGPAGAGDNFLILTANGSGGANGRMVAYNLAQWSGNYLTAGVARVTMQVKNFTAATLQLRVVLKTGFGPSAGFSSIAPFTLPPASGWKRAVFELDETALTRVNSSTLTFGSLITNVVELRLVNSSVPSIIGDITTGSLGVDNIQALRSTGPQLNIMAMTGQFQLSWIAAGAAGFRLESAEDLSAGAGTWTPVAATQMLVNGTNVVILPLQTNGQTFYRLNLP